MGATELAPCAGGCGNLAPGQYTYCGDCVRTRHERMVAMGYAEPKPPPQQSPRPQKPSPIAPCYVCDREAQQITIHGVLLCLRCKEENRCPSET